jgi:hypothetical protein
MVVMPPMVVMAMMVVRQNMHDRWRHVQVVVMVAVMPPHMSMMAVMVVMLNRLQQAGTVLDRGR